MKVSTEGADHRETADMYIHSVHLIYITHEIGIFTCGLLLLIIMITHI